MDKWKRLRITFPVASRFFRKGKGDIVIFTVRIPLPDWLSRYLIEQNIIDYENTKGDEWWNS